MGRKGGKKQPPAPKAGTVRRMSVLSRLHANMNRVDKDLGTWMYGLLWFNEDIGVDAVREVVKRKLLTIPRFRSHLKLVKGKEVFVELPIEEVDIEYHVREVAQPFTRDQVLQEYVDDAFKNFEFNMDLPMWQITYFRDVEGRSLMLFTVSHAIGDGVSIVEVLYRMMDTAEEKAEYLAKSSGTRQQQQPKAPVADLPNEDDDQDDDDAQDEEDIVVGMMPELENGGGLSMEKTPPPQQAGAGAARGKKPKNGFGPLNKTRILLGGAISPLFSAFGSADTPSPLMRENMQEPSSLKSTAYTDMIDLERLKAVKNKFPGATLNDVMVAMLSMTLKSYLEELAATTDNEKTKAGALRMLAGKGKMRASFPINVRKPKSDPFRDHSPHNKIALGDLRFQFKYESRAQLVYDTKRKLDAIKLSPAPFVQQKLANMFIATMSKKAVTELFQKVGEQMTCMLSNVPGPAKKVTIAGCELDDLSFALHGGPGLYLGLLSYAGTVSCCVCVDASLANAKDIAKHWKTEFEGLYKEVMAYEDYVPNHSGCCCCCDKL